MKYAIKQVNKFRQADYVISAPDNSNLATVHFSGYEFRKATVSFSDQTWKLKSSFFSGRVSLQRTDKPVNASITYPRYYSDGNILKIGDSTYFLKTITGKSIKSLNTISWHKNNTEIARITFKGPFTFNLEASAEIFGDGLKDKNAPLLLFLGFFIFRHSPTIFNQ